MASKGVTDRQKSADSVIAASETHAARIGEALKRLLASRTDARDGAPDFADVTLGLGRVLTAQRDRLIAADEANEAELADDAAERARRDEGAAALRAAAVTLREILIGVYGTEFASSILTGSTPEDPVVLSRFAGEVIRKLRDATPPPARVAGASLDLARAATELGDLTGALDEQLKHVQLEARQAQATVVAKASAMAAYDATFTGVAGTLSGLLRLAGERELAARVRPSGRRPGQTAEAAGDPPDPVG